MATGAPYNPAKVVAIIDGRPVNASRQAIDGVDLSARYGVTFARRAIGSAFRQTATYLDITQALLDGAPQLGVTGNFYQPRHFRARAGATWTHGSTTLSAFANRDWRAARYRDIPIPALPIKAVTTLDLIGRWSGPQDLDITLSLANALNTKPTLVPGQPYDTSFDATAYAATGRVATILIAKRF
ncbi:hypothetical protein ACRAWD_04655 [Caulobacter segnis]